MSYDHTSFNLNVLDPIDELSQLHRIITKYLTKFKYAVFEHNTNSYSLLMNIFRNISCIHDQFVKNFGSDILCVSDKDKVILEVQKTHASKFLCDHDKCITTINTFISKTNDITPNTISIGFNENQDINLIIQSKMGNTITYPMFFTEIETILHCFKQLIDHMGDHLMEFKIFRELTANYECPMKVICIVNDRLQIDNRIIRIQHEKDIGFCICQDDDDCVVLMNEYLYDIKNLFKNGHVLPRGKLVKLVDSLSPSMIPPDYIIDLCNILKYGVIYDRLFTDNHIPEMFKQYIINCTDKKYIVYIMGDILSFPSSDRQEIIKIIIEKLNDSEIAQILDVMIQFEKNYVIEILGQRYKSVLEYNSIPQQHQEILPPPKPTPCVKQKIGGTQVPPRPPPLNSHH